MRGMNQSKQETQEQEVGHLNIVVIGVSELKWNGMGHLKSDNSGNDKLNRNRVALILRQDVAQAGRK